MDRCTVIALDTPGYGHSDPLAPPAPPMGDFTRALGAAVDRLGLTRVASYGAHTGAAIAAAYALEAPRRVQSLVCDGLAAFKPREREDFLSRYLVPNVPRWNVTRLAVLWSRANDHYRWSSWHERTRATRLATPIPPPDVVCSALEDFLFAGNTCRRGYACAATFEAAAAVTTLRVPTLFLARGHTTRSSRISTAWRRRRCGSRDRAPRSRLGRARSARISRPASATFYLGPRGACDANERPRRAASFCSGVGATCTSVAWSWVPRHCVACSGSLPRRAWENDLPGCGASDPDRDVSQLLDAAGGGQCPAGTRPRSLGGLRVGAGRRGRGAALGWTGGRGPCLARRPERSASRRGRAGRRARCRRRQLSRHPVPATMR